MKFLLKPVLALAMLAMMATSAKAQDTLKVTLKEGIVNVILGLEMYFI